MFQAGLFLVCRSGLCARSSSLDLFFTHRHSKFDLHFPLDAFENLRLLLQRRLGILASLSQAIALIGKPRTTLVDDVLCDGQIQNIAFARDAFAIHDVKLALTERRRHFIFRDLDLRAVPYYAVSVLDGSDASD